MVLLLNAHNLEALTAGPKQDPVKLRDSVNRTLEVNGSNYSLVDAGEARDYLANLSENLFLGRAARTLCSPLLKGDLRKKAVSQPMIGLLLGSAIQNSALIRSSFVDLVRENN